MTRLSPLPMRPEAAPSRRKGQAAVTRAWVRSQKVNLQRAAIALAPFDTNAFGSGPAAPKPPQIDAANLLIGDMQKSLGVLAQRMPQDASVKALRETQRLKGEAATALARAEKLWSFYYEIFSQRNAGFANQLLAADRISKDCYQAVYMNLGTARKIPSPTPLAYVDTGFGAATFRRGVRLTALSKRQNPFPLVIIPPVRLAAPWTLGAIPHEVGHNIQSDLGLWLEIRKEISKALAAKGHNRLVRVTLARWSKEIYADLIGVLLIGPAYVRSLMDVVGKDWMRTSFFNKGGVHPTPLLRVPLNTILLERMGFEDDARAIRDAWRLMYPGELDKNLPPEMRKAFLAAAGVAVDTIINRKLPAYGDQSLIETVRFTPDDQKRAVEGAKRLATGKTTGILPSRFLIAAARIAFDRRYAEPAAITKAFYDALTRR